MKTLFRKLIVIELLIVSIIALVTVLNFNIQNVSACETSNTNVENTVDDTTEVISYKDIFKYYYEIARSETEQTGENDFCTFYEFCDKYYYSGMDLPTYTHAIINSKATDNLYDISASENVISSSADADYILSDRDYSLTPATEFKREPTYSIYDFSSIREGDIIFETETILFNTGHTAMVYEASKPSAFGNYIQTIEAVGSGVVFGFLDDTRMVDFGVIILRVNGITDIVCQNVKYFSYEQLGKPYNLNITRLNTSIDSTEWYCSELTYAAYKYADIDIGVTKDNVGNDVYLSLGCLPNDIYKSYNTYAPHISGFLDMAIVCKVGSTWTIAVYNLHNYDITFEYNTKMCFRGDAENWSGLNHKATKNVEAGKSTTVEISEFGFATTVVVSWIDQNKRMITYGYQLNTSGSIKIVYNGIEI